MSVTPLSGFLMDMIRQLYSGPTMGLLTRSCWKIAITPCFHPSVKFMGALKTAPAQA